MSDQTPFYTNDDKNKSLPVGLVLAGNMETVKQTIVSGRKSDLPALFSSSTAGFGFPGIPFVAGVPAPPNFCQGEDIIFDTFLFYAGTEVTTEKFNISASIKRAFRAVNFIWTGSIGSGVYKEDREGYYTIWIPSAKTEDIYAGSYILNIFLTEAVGDGEGPHDRKISLVDVMFNVEYCGGSKNPENVRRAGDLKGRNSLNRSWPNSSDTVHG
jgi:hypothetical protein